LGSDLLLKALGIGSPGRGKKSNSCIWGSSTPERTPREKMATGGGRGERRARGTASTRRRGGMKRGLKSRRLPKVRRENGSTLYIPPGTLHIGGISWDPTKGGTSSEKGFLPSDTHWASRKTTTLKKAQIMLSYEGIRD